MGYNSRQDYFLGQELPLDFAAWIDLTSNADNWLISPSCVRSYRTHFVSLKRVDDLRVYQGFMMPFNHQAGYKVLINNAYTSLFWANGICFDAQSIDVTITSK